ncbi:hypothetical protein CS063_14305 [Sporanaerobium hydrogeniformans]|uniref:Uncharacterized protein n=1 Tax=Sporanaerobium hydrogeniformans TaxID=3072179 RepID=A0AC61D9Q4_9FIRM|nr:ABC transporter ATP-binding protein [Sporanaerobium hydrogeniformans]PHV69762.1 hypothetical protein CS063_14305 [Sporanaerobium hydrogeniformans]
MNLLRIWKLAEHKTLFVFQVLMNIGLAFITIAVSDFTRKAVDQGIGGGQISTTILKFVLLTLIGTVLSYGSVICQGRFSVLLIERLRNMTTAKLVNAEYGFYEKETTGSISNRMLRDMTCVADYMSGGMPEFLTNIIIFACCFMYLLKVNLAMTLVSAICIPMAVILAKKVASPTYDTIEKFETKIDEVIEIAQDTIHNVRVEKVYGLQDLRKDYFDKNIDEATAYYVKYEKLVAKAGGYKYIIKAMPMLICIFIGFYNSYRGNITSGELIAFVLLLQNVSKPLSELTRYVTEFKEAMVSVDRMMQIVDVKEEAFGEEEEKEKSLVFELKDISFSYDVADEQGNKEILSHINMQISQGKAIALVGASGSGKSTLFKLLMGFHKPTKGEVCLYGRSLNDWDIEKARRQMAYVAQDTYLFEGTVAENIGYGKEGATLEEIIEAAKKAYANEFIMAMPQGYQTVISERGSNLSGGQRQRLGIARALLKDAPIFLLDEMTSALDVESEKLIQKAIEEYSKSKTVILIAHRLSTIRQADEIYVLDQGQVIEKGSHEDLIAKSGMYSKLYSNQQNQISYKEMATSEDTL